MKVDFYVVISKVKIFERREEMFLWCVEYLKYGKKYSRYHNFKFNLRSLKLISSVETLKKMQLGECSCGLR